MKKYKVILLFVFTIWIYSNCYSQNFRKSNFGDPIKKVKTIEGIPINEFIREIDSSTCIVYNSKLGGINSYALFTFKDDKFIRGAYDLTNSDSLNQTSFTQFKIIEKLLINKYGSPNKAIDFGTNAKFNKEIQLASEWYLDKIKISHTLFSSNFHIVDYE